MAQYPSLIPSLVGAIASFLVGGVIMALFGKQMDRLAGKTEKTNAPRPGMLGGIFLANVAMAFGISFVMNAVSPQSWMDVLMLEVWIILGFVAPLTLGVVWEGKPIAWWLSTVALNVVSLFAMMAVMYIM